MNRTVRNATRGGATTTVDLCGARARRWLPLALAIVVAAGALLRWPNLGEASLWHDELASWVAATRPSTVRGVLEVAGGEDMHPPGYYLLLRIATRLAGESEAAMRLPSAIAGTLAIAVLYGLGAALYGVREGLIAAVLCAVLPFPVIYSREARAYSLLFLGAMVTAWLLVRARERIVAAERAASLGATGGQRAHPLVEPPWSQLLGFAATGCVVAYLHYFGMVLVGLETLTALFLVRRCGRRRIAAALVVLFPVMLAVWWLPWMSLAMARRSYWPQPPSWRTPLVFFNTFFFQAWQASSLVLVVLAVAAALFVVRARRDGRRPEPSFATLMCLVWIAAPFAVLLGFSLVRFSIAIDRALIIVLPPLYLLVARGMTFLLPRARGQIAATAGLVVLAAARWVTSDGYRDLHVRQDYRGATAAYRAAVEARADTLGVVLVVAPAKTPLLAYYLDRGKAMDSIDLLVSSELDLRELAQRLRADPPSELVMFCQLPRLTPGAIAVIEGSYELIDSQWYGGRLELRRYRLRRSS